ELWKFRESEASPRAEKKAPLSCLYGGDSDRNLLGTKPFQARLSGSYAAPPFAVLEGPARRQNPQELDHALRNEKDACPRPHGLGSSRHAAFGHHARIGRSKA